VIPLGKGCNPSNSGFLLTAILSCNHISIDSYTETFQENFLDLVVILERNGMAGAINTIQLDYVDTFDLAAIVRLNAEVTTTQSSITRASNFPEAAKAAGLRPCWDDLINDSIDEMSSPHIKLYSDYSCQGNQLTKYGNDSNLKDDAMSRIWFWVRENWNDKVHSVSAVRCARSNLPLEEQQCIDGTYVDLRLVLYPDSDYRGDPLTLTCDSPAEDFEMGVGDHVKTQMACSWNLPADWVEKVSSLQIQELDQSKRRQKQRQLLRTNEILEVEAEWETIEGIRRI
jgi:hypothetical protein